MSSPAPTDLYPLPKDSYIAFDALSLRQLIVDRLNAQGVFTDQNYVGSNLASIIDIVAYAYNTLIYYLNKTSTESMFSEAQLYENVNKIVKLLDYKPQGFRTSVLPFTLSVADLESDTPYTIPRYSYVTVSGISYSINEDLSFIRNSDQLQYIQDIAYTKYLVQGRFQMYPVYTAYGNVSEIITLNTDSNILIDHYNIHVYVKANNTSKWVKYEQVQNSYFETSTALKYEARLNGNKQYELKFGDGIGTRQLQKNDSVCVFYLVSDGEKGVVGPGVFTGATALGCPITRYNTVIYQQIINDILTSDNILTDAQTRSCYISNSDSSTDPQASESVQHIKESATSNFQGQYRVVTIKDYVNFITSNFSNLITDVQVMSNTTYMSTYIKYYYDLGITTPTLNTRALYNQVMFSNSCNFNNVYLVIVPKTAITQVSYLLPTQKQLIKDAVDNVKTVTSHTTFVDPVFMSFVLGTVNTSYEDLDVTKEKNTKLLITRSVYNNRSNISIQKEVTDTIINFFNYTKNSLGQVVNIHDLEQQILAINGVGGMSTYRTDNAYSKNNGLSFFVYNPSYPMIDKQHITSSIALMPFQYPYLGDASTIFNKIEVV